MSFMRPLKIYFHILYYNFLGILAYPYELLITVVQPILEVGFLALFWNIVARNSPNHIDLTHIVAYFIMVQFVSIWCINPDGLNFAGYVGRNIKFGYLTRDLIRPIRTLPTLLFEHRGFYLIDMIFSVILFAVAIKLLGGITIVQFIWFVVFAFLSFVSVFAFSVLIGSIAFITKEISGIRNSISHLVRLLSGMLVPLTLYPANIKSILVYSPFPSMVFAPINVLQNKLPLSEIIFYLKVSLFWSIVLLTVSILIWKHNIKKYEAIGI